MVEWLVLTKRNIPGRGLACDATVVNDKRVRRDAADNIERAPVAVIDFANREVRRRASIWFGVGGIRVGRKMAYHRGMVLGRLGPIRTLI